MSNDLGRFVWYDLNTKDPVQAQGFYKELLGWHVKPIEMGPEIGTYHMIHVGENGVGGFAPMPPDTPAPPHWMAYVSVDDVDAACERALAAGGKVAMPAMDIPNVGRFAVVMDPTGGVIAPFKTAQDGYLPEPEPPQPAGNFVWNELLTTDVEACKSFYGEVFGWGHKEQDMGEMTYHIFTRGDKDTCGMMMMPPDAQAPPHWIPYIAVDDVDASTAKAVEMGGKNWNTMEMPGVGKFSVNADPQMATFALYKAPAP